MVVGIVGSEKLLHHSRKLYIYREPTDLSLPPNVHDKGKESLGFSSRKKGKRTEKHHSPLQLRKRSHFDAEYRKTPPPQRE